MDPTINPTLQQIHGMLLSQNTALYQALDDATDANAANNILMEMKEVVHRIDLVQNLLFKQSSQQLSDTLKGITAANDELSKAIAGINDIATFLASASDFLKAVDQAIDIAKTLAV